MCQESSIYEGLTHLIKTRAVNDEHYQNMHDEIFQHLNDGLAFENMSPDAKEVVMEWEHLCTEHLND